MGTYVWKERTRGEDNSILIVEFEGGATAMIEDSWAKFGGMEDATEIYGSGGSAYADLPCAELMLLSYLRATTTRWKRPTLRKGGPFTMFEEMFNSGYLHEIEHFISCIADGTPPRVTGKMAAPCWKSSSPVTRGRRNGEKRSRFRFTPPQAPQETGRPMAGSELTEIPLEVSFVREPRDEWDRYIFTVAKTNTGWWGYTFTLLVMGAVLFLVLAANGIPLVRSAMISTGLGVFFAMYNYRTLVNEVCGTALLLPHAGRSETVRLLSDGIFSLTPTDVKITPWRSISSIELSKKLLPFHAKSGAFHLRATQSVQLRGGYGRVCQASGRTRLKCHVKELMKRWRS